MAWRLIIDSGDVYWNMAIDEAMLVLRDKGVIPNTLRLYVFSPSAVTIGYFQRVEDAVDTSFLEKHGIDFTRRITGGGSVYHDKYGEVTYSVVAGINDISRDIEESYRIICNGIVYAIEEFGLKPVFKPVNDVVVNNKKISGSAQARKKNALLQHGTLMYATNIDLLARCLKAPKQKLESHGVRSIRERVTTLSIELGRRVSRNEVIEALIKGFKKALGVNEFKLSTYTVDEINIASVLKKKYMSREWIYRR